MKRQSVLSGWWKGAKRSKSLWLVCLALVPIIAGALYALTVRVHMLFRYDTNLFSAEYQDLYASPGFVALELEQALRSGDLARYTELTGLRDSPDSLQANPDLVLTILLDVDEKGYFHYLYMDMETLLRQTHYIKKINGRWVVAPQDSYFYLDSGRWIATITPIAAVWWSVLIVTAMMMYVFRISTNLRTAMGR